MQPALTTAAQVLHDIGLAAGFGGSLFGKVALGPAVRVIHDKEERGKVIHEAWTGYRWVNAFSLASAALTWFTGRAALSGKVLGRPARNAVIAKDILVGVATASTIGCVALGSYLGEGSRGFIPVEEGETPAAGTPPEKARALRAIGVLGTINIAAMAGVIGITAFLYQRSSSSVRWGVVSKFFP